MVGLLLVHGMLLASLEGDWSFPYCPGPLVCVQGLQRTGWYQGHAIEGHSGKGRRQGKSTGVLGGGPAFLVNKRPRKGVVLGR